MVIAIYTAMTIKLEYVTIFGFPIFSGRLKSGFILLKTGFPFPKHRSNCDYYHQYR
ncbi:hypothetical protein VPMS16_734 [Vibrio sp. 16]|nr:hypothetical protein VPMS16_734 [Vibrio sp. 16]